LAILSKFDESLTWEVWKQVYLERLQFYRQLIGVIKYPRVTLLYEEKAY